MAIQAVEREFAVPGTIFLPPVIEDLGFEPPYVSSVPIGRGAHHEVFLYTPPNGTPKALKTHRRSCIGIRQSADSEERDIELIAKYLPENSVPAQVLRTNDDYLVEMDFVPGDHLSFQNLLEYREGLEELLERNAIMMKEACRSVELLGREAAKDFLTLNVLRGKPSRLSNVKIDQDGLLKLTGHTLLPIDLPPYSLEGFKCSVVMAVNDLLLGVRKRRRYVDYSI